jgi:hypothetical protein
MEMRVKDHEKHLIKQKARLTFKNRVKQAFFSGFLQFA